MEVRVDVNENDIVRVKIGDTTNIDVDAYNTYEQVFKGIVTEIASTANPKPSPDAVTEFKVKIRVINESYRNLTIEEGIKNPFKPGMTASVEIITQVKDEILLIPISSVTTKNEKDSLGNESIKQIVFVNDNGKAKMVEVTTGISDFENIEVLSGLNENDQVISGPYIAISQKLKNDSKVNVTKVDDKKVDGSENGDEGVSVSVRIGN